MILEARNLKKKFGTLSILENASLSLKQGESLAITGKSGRGKTTLLYLLSGLDHIDAGTISVKNIRIDNLSEQKMTLFRKNNFGFIFQHHFLLNELTALENALLPLRVSGSISKEKIEEAEYFFELLNISDRRHNYPDILSGGEAQRTSVIRALINDPLIIFADEPTGSLDEYNSEILETVFFNLIKEKGISLIISTHNKTLANKCTIHKTIDELENKI